MLATTQDIKNLGLDESVFDLSDEKAEGEILSALDDFLLGYIFEASLRLGDWVGTENYTSADNKDDEKMSLQLKRAEIYLALVRLMPLVWQRAGIEETSINFDGMAINMARTSKEEQQQILQTFLQNAESLAKPWIPPVEFGGIKS